MNWVDVMAGEDERGFVSLSSEERTFLMLRLRKQVHVFKLMMAVLMFNIVILLLFFVPFLAKGYDYLYIAVNMIYLAFILFVGLYFVLMVFRVSSGFALPIFIWEDPMDLSAFKRPPRNTYRAITEAVKKRTKSYYLILGELFIVLLVNTLVWLFHRLELAVVTLIFLVVGIIVLIYLIWKNNVMILQLRQML